MIETIVTGDLQVNTYLYNYRENKIIVIDPGADSQKIINVINKKKYEPTGILLTHGHFDHIGATRAIKDLWGIPLYIHSEDAYLVGSNAKEAQKNMLASIGVMDDYSLNNYLTETPDPDVLLNDQDILEEFNLKIIHTPGHTKGSSCFYSFSEKIIFSGDTLFKKGVGRTDLPGGNYKQIKLSLETLFKLPGETIVYPGHGSSTCIRNELNTMQLY